MVTKEIAQGWRVDLDMYLSVMDSESRKVGDVLTQYSTWSTDLVAITLSTELGNLHQAKVSSVGLKKGKV